MSVTICVFCEDEVWGDDFLQVEDSVACGACASGLRKLAAAIVEQMKALPRRGGPILVSLAKRPPLDE